MAILWICQPVWGDLEWKCMHNMDTMDTPVGQCRPTGGTKPGFLSHAAQKKPFNVHQ
jgi:hypothetical protein